MHKQKPIDYKRLNLLTRLDTYGRGIAQLISGYPGSVNVSQTPNLTPLQTALGVATNMDGGLFGDKK